MRDWLLKARKEKNLTQLQVSEMLGISESYYSFIEAGTRQKKLELPMASKLSEILGISIRQIVELEEASK
jgi:transcriptional regulator with XRE-family HTH domain